MRFLIFALMVVGLAGGARADVTAVYRQVSGDGIVRIEIADNGDARFEMTGENWHLIYAAGVSYAVYAFPGGPMVARVEDLQRLAAERGGPAPQLGIAAMRIVERGTTRIGGYSGIAYHLALPDGVSPRPQLVISSDPALAPIGRAWLRQVDFTIAMVRRRGAPVPPTLLRIREILAEGTPVFYGGHALGPLDRSPISPDRFRLPAEPFTMDQLRRGAARALLEGTSQ